MEGNDRPPAAASGPSNRLSSSPPPSDPRDVPSIFSSNQSRPARSATPSRLIRSRPAPVSIEPQDSQASPTRARSGSQALGSASTEGPLSPDAADRVFPIRSYVSVDPAPLTSSTTTSTSGDVRTEYFPSASRLANRRMSTAGNIPARIQEGSSLPQTPASEIPNDESVASRKTSTSTNAGPHTLSANPGTFNFASDQASVTGSASVKGPPSVEMAPSETDLGRVGEEEAGSLVTARFKHVVTDGGHCVITGRDGETLQRCEDEPIHIPGAVQTFGALVAVREESDGKLVVRAVSENCKRILGYSPKQLFALESFTDILSEENADNLLDHIDFIRDEGASIEMDGPEVFTMSIRHSKRRPQKLWCAIHHNPKNQDIIICEFELEDDLEYPLVPLNDETPEPPEDTLASDPSADELKESTESLSKPLRVLRSARKRKGEAAAMEVFNIMSQVQEQLARAPNLPQFLKILVGVVKELTGFHRVMIYQFDQNWNGSVVTELVDPRATKDLYKGLHFPASDIPKQARDLYKINKVRLLYDRDQETARLVCRTPEDLKSPLDLTHSYLRAMSPIHVKYLKNMAVRSSMSISINAFNELWGLISCHTYGIKGTRVSFPIRKMCRLIGDSASRNIERISYASRLQARKLINTAPTKHNPSGYIIASSNDLLKLFDADFGLLSIHDETKILGNIQGTQEALAMLEYLRMRRFGSVTLSQDIRGDFPDLRYPPGFQVIAGLLLVPLTAAGQDFIVFFRKGQMQEVKWAGNPYEKYIKEGTEGYLEPRQSFKAWSETVVGKCREWTEEEIETAAVLCLVYGKFIEVWRQKEDALQNTQLTKLLLANSAHEVRTPLNAIINYLEIALEGSLDQETRDNLSKSHSASKSLIYVINDLLDLTKTESGDQLIHEEVFEILTTFREGVNVFEGEAKRKNIAFNVTEHPNIPDKVVGDQRRVRQAISNIVANAVQATTEGGVHVEIRVANWVEGRQIDIEVSVEDTGAGMDSAKLDRLFTELEQAQSSPDPLVEETLATDAKTITDGKAPDKQTLGLGLAIVARIIRNMNGQLRVKSEAGKGSRFVMQLPFDLPDGVPNNVLTQATPAPDVADDALQEMTLVPKSDDHRDSSRGSPTPSRRNSAESITSRKSLNSLKSNRSLASGVSFGSKGSNKSEADRLIEAIQEPYMSEASVSRANSSHTIRDHQQRSRVSWGRDTFQTKRSQSYDGTIPSDAEAPPPTSNNLSAVSSAGSLQVSGSRTPIKALRMNQSDVESPNPATTPPHVNKEPQTTDSEKPYRKDGGQRLERIAELKADPESISSFRVLVAEDDPINSKIVQKRLSKLGHTTHLCVNGEECARVFGEQLGDFDIVLMDMQMPIVDGLTSTKMIRSEEKSRPSEPKSVCADVNGRIPIIAVSASLVEKERHVYIEAGFDAWILKPINFNRLNDLMKAAINDDLRETALYSNHRNWENGGWFHNEKADVGQTETEPDTDKTPFTKGAELKQEHKAEHDKAEGDAEVSADREAALQDQPRAEPAETTPVSQLPPG